MIAAVTHALFCLLIATNRITERGRAPRADSTPPERSLRPLPRGATFRRTGNFLPRNRFRLGLSLRRTGRNPNP